MPGQEMKQEIKTKDILIDELLHKHDPNLLDYLTNIGYDLENIVNAINDIQKISTITKMNFNDLQSEISSSYDNYKLNQHKTMLKKNYPKSLNKELFNLIDKLVFHQKDVKTLDYHVMSNYILDFGNDYTTILIDYNGTNEGNGEWFLNGIVIDDETKDDTITELNDIHKKLKLSSETKLNELFLFILFVMNVNDYECVYELLKKHI